MFSILMRDKVLSTAWNSFWFSTASRETLSLLRIGIGIIVILKMTDYSGILRFFNLSHQFSYHYFQTPQAYLLNGYRMPYPFLDWLPVPSFEAYRSIEILVMILAVLFTVGLFTRLVGPLLAVFFGYLFLLSQLLYHHHVFILVISLVILGFSRCDEYYSLDSLSPMYRKRPIPERSILPLRLVQVQVTFLYAGTFLNKLNDGWFSGEVVNILRKSHQIFGPFADLFFSLVSSRTLGIMVICITGFLTWGLWIPKLRKIAIYLGVLLHLGIDSMMIVHTYSYTVLLLYIAFIYPRSKQNIILYDGYCLMCNRARRTTKAFDWLQRIRFIDLYDKKSIASLKITIPTTEVLLKEMYLIDGNKNVHKGFYAWRKIATLLPITFLFAPLLYLPSIPTLGEKIYSHIAINRERLFKTENAIK